MDVNQDNIIQAGDLDGLFSVLNNSEFLDHPVRAHVVGGV